MLLYLVQHGQATSKEEDPDRPLTEEGRRQVESVMLFLMRYGAVTAARVLHSGKLRAAETARLIAAKLDVEAQETDGLLPGDDPGVWMDRLPDTADLMLVGHLPHLSRLASGLLAGDSDAALVHFTNGGVACLRAEEGAWALEWSVPPSLVS